MNTSSGGSTECSPIAVFLVSSGPRGDRLLFRYPFLETSPSSSAPLVISPQNRFKRKINRHVEEYCIPSKSAWSGFERFIKDGQLTGYVDDTLAHLLAVKNNCCGKPFMVKINDVVFTGYPMQYEEWEGVGGGRHKIKVYINIVFALMDCMDSAIVKSYQQLCKSLSASLIREDARCSYLSIQKHIMWTIHDEEPTPSGAGDMDVDGQKREAHESYEKVLSRCCLARSLRLVFEDLRRSRSTNVHINKWVHLSFCVGPKKAMKEVTGCIEMLRPHLSLLLLEDKRAILGGMRPNASPLFHQMLKAASPRKNFVQIAFSADLTLCQTFLLASQLVYWGKAVIIYPIKPSNIYILNPSAPQIGVTSSLVTQFTKAFPNEALTLFHIAALFSRPTKLSNHVRPLTATTQAYDSMMRRDKSVHGATLSAALVEHQASLRTPFRQLSGRWDGNELVIYNNALENNRGGHLARANRSTNQVAVVRRRDYHRPDNGRQSISGLDNSYNSNEQLENEADLTKSDLTESWNEEPSNKSIHSSGLYSNTPKTSYEMSSAERRAEGLRSGQPYCSATIPRENLRRRVTSAMTPTHRQSYLESATYAQNAPSGAVPSGELSRSNPALNHYSSTKGSDTPVTPLIPRDYFLTPRQPLPPSADPISPSTLTGSSGDGSKKSGTADSRQQHVRYSLTGRDSPGVSDRQQLQQQLRLRRESELTKQQQWSSVIEVDESDEIESEKVKAREAFKCCSEIVVWLLHHALISQLHTFVRLFVPPSTSSSTKAPVVVPPPISKTTSHRFTTHPVAETSTKYSIRPVVSDRNGNTVSTDGNKISGARPEPQGLDPVRHSESKLLIQTLPEWKPAGSVTPDKFPSKLLGSVALEKSSVQTSSDLESKLESNLIPRRFDLQPTKTKLSEMNVSENFTRASHRPRAFTMTHVSTKSPGKSPGGAIPHSSGVETGVSHERRCYSISSGTTKRQTASNVTSNAGSKSEFGTSAGGRSGNKHDAGAMDGWNGDGRSVMLYKVPDSVLAQAGLTREQIEGVCKCPASKDPRSLAMFARLARYFDGTVSVEVMAFSENLPVSHVVSTIDKFRDVLFTFQHIVNVNVPR